jgi:hypothetical protein
MNHGLRRSRVISLRPWNLAPSPRCAAWAAILVASVARTAWAGGLDDALALVPRDAVAMLAVPSVKSASDDLQLAIDRMGKAEAALGGRPIDLLKAQARIGPGFDDRGAVVAWARPVAGGLAHVVAMPVTDAPSFVAATLVPDPAAGEGAMRAPGIDGPVWHRISGSHVLVADRKEALADAAPEASTAQPGFPATLAARVGTRGMEIMRTADVVAWASTPAITSMVARMRDSADLERRAAEAIDAAAGAAAIARRWEDEAAARDRVARMLGEAQDLVVTVDFDALAVGLRAFARFDPAGEVAKAMPSGARAGAGAASMLARLPGAAFYAAAGIDLQSMGGLRHVRAYLATLPGAGRMLPLEWLDGAEDAVQQVQVAAYPSKLGILSGGIMNDASFVVTTEDPQAVVAALRRWVEAQAGEGGGVRREPTWEEARALKDGSTVTAFAVKETVTGPGGDVTERLMRQVLLSARGLHGFVRTVPGAVVVTFSQRTDVLGRATAAATPGAAKTLAASPVVRAMSGWLVPEPDFVMFLGAGELMAAAQQVADAVPGMAGIAIPQAGAATEPLATAFRSRDGTWEAAVVVPAGVLGLAFDAAKGQVRE